MRELESRRQKLQSDIGIYNQKIDELKQDLLRQQTELERLKISVEQAQVAQREAVQRNTPELALPIALLPSKIPKYQRPVAKLSQNCRMHSCFDHSRCSLSSGFPVFLYDPDEHSVVGSGFEIDGFLKTTIKQTLGYNAHLTHDPKVACIYLVLVGEALPENEIVKNNRYPMPNDINASGYQSAINLTSLRKLPFWGGDGRNHVLINLARRDLSSGAGNAFRDQDTARAIIVQSSFGEMQFRPGFDIVVPPVLGPPGGDVWQECGSIVPARRKLLLSFQGEMRPLRTGNATTKIMDDEEQLDDFIIDHLKEMTKGTTQDNFLLQFECVPATEQKTFFPIRDWSLCGTDSSRKQVLRESTFALLLAPGGKEASSTLLQARLYEALRAGAIPVIIGGDQVLLPYADTIDWRRIAILLPKGRITELHFLLRAVPDSDLLAMRRQARMIWERYLSSVQATVDTIVASLRDRLGKIARKKFN